MRYSVGDMHSTSGAREAISASRSPASNRASCSTASPSPSSAASQTLRSDFDHPAAAVHQIRWPGRTPIHRSTWSRLAGT